VIEFLLNQERVQLDGLAPNLSVLDWLRTQKGLTGTKEGCASGDCGACTVLLGSMDADGLRYRSVNACLLLLAQVQGQHLLTVEGLTESGDLTLDRLHPVQQAMVAYHGAQCGFCTPGFIMSLTGLYLNHRDYPGDSVVIHALGGNLCRCTGYRPILDAARSLFQTPPVELLTSPAAAAFFAAPLDLQPSLSAAGRTIYLPQDLASLLRLRAANPAARLVAGGTDLCLEFSQQLKPCPDLISVAQVAELKSCTTLDGALSIGAAVPYSEFQTTINALYPQAAELWTRLGSEQIRNAGTLGGSLGNASPIGDPAPLLLALSATVLCSSVEGERELPVADFFTAYRQTLLRPNEVIRAVHIPAHSVATKLVCYKISKRIEDDISAVLCVIAYELDDNQIVRVRTGFGGMAATPAPARRVEQALLGQDFSLATLQRAAEQLATDFQPLSDVRASSAYRLTVAQNLFERLWYQHQGDIEVRVAHAAL
jgi:xanthine dehydrogenase small subunit